MNLITFRGLKSGPVAFLGLLSLKLLKQHNTRQKMACKMLIGESKGAY